MTTIEQLLNTPHIVHLAAREGLPATDVAVREVRMCELQTFIQKCSPFMHAFDEAGALARRVNKETGDVQEASAFDLFKLLADQSPAFMDAAVCVTNQPRAFYEQLLPNEFFDVCAKIVEVNGSFFALRLAPSLIKLAQGAISLGRLLSLQSQPL